MPRDTVGRSVSRSLGEIRTVHSRAVTGLQKMQSHWYAGDIDRDEMIADLEQVVQILDKWKRTGR